MVSHPRAVYSTSSPPFPAYPSGLSDPEWALLAPLLPPPARRGRPPCWSLRLIIDALFYLLRAGCPWRLLPHPYPPWGTVYHYFRTRQRTGRWHRIYDALCQRV